MYVRQMYLLLSIFIGMVIEKLLHFVNIVFLVIEGVPTLHRHEKLYI